MPTAPEFISTDVQSVLTETIAQYEAASGRTLQPAHVERLLLNVVAYREAMLRERIQYSATQNLVSFADGLALDYLGELVGATRLAATPASCTLRFVMVDGHGGSTIPAGTRVATTDGKFVFRTLEDAVVLSSDENKDVLAESTVTGTGANGYIAGNVQTLQDPLSYITSVANIGETGGGSDTEVDDRFRERIILASGQFSNAGSRAAYSYHARTANPSIIDVWVDSIDPGTVQIYPLVLGAVVTPTEVLDQVLAACNDERVRPLTDLVTVISPTIEDFDLDVEVKLYAYADPTDAEAAIVAALTTLGNTKRSRLGQDVPTSQVIAAIMSVDGVYGVDSLGTFTGLVIDPNAVANLGSIAVTISGTIDE